MIDPPPLPMPGEEPIRFRLPTLLLVTAVVAALAAALGPFYRHAIPENRHELIAAWTGASLVIGLYARRLWKDSKRRQQKLGACRISLRQPWRAPIRFLVAMFLWGMLLFWSLAGLVMMGFNARRLMMHGSIPSAAIGGATVGFLVMMSVSGLRAAAVKRGRIELCEHGIRVADQVVPWQWVARLDWKSRRTLQLKLLTLFRTFTVFVPPEDREALVQLLREKTELEIDLP